MEFDWTNAIVGVQRYLLSEGLLILKLQDKRMRKLQTRGLDLNPIQNGGYQFKFNTTEK